MNTQINWQNFNTNPPRASNNNVCHVHFLTLPLDYTMKALPSLQKYKMITKALHSHKFITYIQGTVK